MAPVTLELDAVLFDMVSLSSLSRQQLSEETGRARQRRGTLSPLSPSLFFLNVAFILTLLLYYRMGPSSPQHQL